MKEISSNRGLAFFKTTVNKANRVLLYCMLGFFILACQNSSLKKYGISYVMTDGESATYKKIQFFRDIGGKRIQGPEIFGTELKVDAKILENENILRIKVFSKTFKNDQTIIEIDSNAQSGFKFNIVNNVGLNINYPEAGFIYP